MLPAMIPPETRIGRDESNGAASPGDRADNSTGETLADDVPLDCCARQHGNWVNVIKSKNTTAVFFMAQRLISPNLPTAKKRRFI
jgi:hypothetical protein